MTYRSTVPVLAALCSTLLLMAGILLLVAILLVSAMPSDELDWTSSSVALPWRSTLRSAQPGRMAGTLAESLALALVLLL